jgi:hypothetical protein
VLSARIVDDRTLQRIVPHDLESGPARSHVDEVAVVSRWDAERIDHRTEGPLAVVDGPAPKEDLGVLPPDAKLTDRCGQPDPRLAIEQPGHIRRGAAGGVDALFQHEARLEPVPEFDRAPQSEPGAKDRAVLDSDDVSTRAAVHDVEVEVEVSIQRQRDVSQALRQWSRGSRRRRWSRGQYRWRGRRGRGLLRGCGRRGRGLLRGCGRRGRRRLLRCLCEGDTRSDEWERAERVRKLSRVHDGTSARRDVALVASEHSTRLRCDSSWPHGKRTSSYISRPVQRRPLDYTNQFVQ